MAKDTLKILQIFKVYLTTCMKDWKGMKTATHFPNETSEYRIRMSHIFKIPSISNEKPSISIEIPSISIKNLGFRSKY